MGAAMPVVPPPTLPAFAVDDRVEILTGPGIKRWRPGKVLKVTRCRVTVKYFVNRGLSERRQAVPYNRVRPRREAPKPEELLP